MRYALKHTPSGKLCDVEELGAPRTYASISEARAARPEGYEGNYEVVEYPQATMREFQTTRTTVIIDYNDHKRRQYRARVSKRANEFGEFRVKFYEDGVYMGDGPDYFGSDYQDALHTARACILFMCADKGN